MDLPSLRQLRTFLAAIDLGSITEAARSLNLTQPAASQQLREMERLLGLRLLERAEGRVIPTAAGAAMLDPARRCLLAATEAVTAAAAHRSGEAGQVRLGTGATACIHLLPPVLALVRQRMPGLQVAVVIGNTGEMLRRVEEGSLDAGLVTLPRATAPALARMPLCRDDLQALAPADWPGQGALTPAQLAERPLILYERGGDTRSIIDAWFARAGLAPRPMMELGSVEAIKVLVAGGLGAAVLPGMALRDPVPGAVTRPLRPALSRQLGLVLRKEKVLDRGLRVLTEALQASTP